MRSYAFLKLCKHYRRVLMWGCCRVLITKLIQIKTQYSTYNIVLLTLQQFSDTIFLYILYTKLCIVCESDLVLWLGQDNNITLTLCYSVDKALEIHNYTSVYLLKQMFYHIFIHYRKFVIFFTQYHIHI